MGLAEVLRHLPRLLRLRGALLAALLAARPDVFVGIDAPEFNLRPGAATEAGRHPTVQYVSPQVWAWRQGRVRTIGASCDLVLCLLPFETEFYARHGVQAVFVGHPLADEIPLAGRSRAPRAAALGLPRERHVVALLPGSRMGEVDAAGRAFHRRRRLVAARGPTGASSRPWPRPPLVRRSRGKSRKCPARQRFSVWTARRSGRWRPPTGCSWPPAPPLWRRCSRAARWWSRTGSSALTAFLLRTWGSSRCDTFRSRTCSRAARLVPEFFQEQVSGPALADALLRNWRNRPTCSNCSRNSRRFTARCAGAARRGRPHVGRYSSAREASVRRWLDRHASPASMRPAAARSQDRWWRRR